MPDITLDPQQQEAFNQFVWEIARQIPPGKVASYGQIAGLIPTPEGIGEPEYLAFRARWAGAAMKACPPDVPWQRVLSAQGKISLPKGSKGYQNQKDLLESEGVVFDNRDKIDLKKFGWAGPPRDWAVTHGLIPPEEDFHQSELPF